MITSDANLEEFVRRLESVISMMNEKRRKFMSSSGADWQIGSYDTLIKNLTDLRDTAVADKLRRPSRGETLPGTGLGLSHVVGEWCEDDELLNHVRSVEDYFRHVL